MDQRIRELMEKQQAAQRESESAAKELARIQAVCSHDWKEEYEPIIQEAYTIPGDPPGTMGVDWSGPVYVPRKVTSRYTRTCLKCGLTQHTDRVSKKTTETPVF